MYGLFIIPPSKVTIIFMLIFSKACDQGKYGNGCNNLCGHCLDQDNCYHTNGTCMTGCKPGYHGALCKTGRIRDLSCR